MLGQGKVGKSDFWSRGDRTLFLECEAGLGHLSVMSMRCTCWDDVRKVGGLLYEEAIKLGFDPSNPKQTREELIGKFPYDTIVVDTVDRFVDYINEEVIHIAKEKYGPTVADKINSIGDIPNGAGWYWAANLSKNTLAKLELLPCAIVLIGHATVKEVKEDMRAAYDKSTISIGGQAGTNLLYWADQTLQMRARMNGEKLERCLRSRPAQSIDAGSRGEIVPDGFVVSEPMADTYARFRKLFD